MPPPPPDPDLPESDRTELEAADWFARCDEGLSAEEELEFQHWLTADPRHADVFAELSETWQVMGRARAPALEAIPGGAKERPRWREWLPTLGAAAAAVAVFCAVEYGRRSLATGTGAAKAYAASASTAVGEQRQWTLPDGSVLDLNTDSAVEVRLNGAERAVRVTRGEVFFTVAHEASRPFVVRAGSVSVRDIGTVFDVRIRGEAVDVLVTEGEVQVESGASRAPVLAGESVSIPAGSPAAGIPAIATVDAPTVDRTVAWRQRQLEFDHEPLGDIVAEFNRYNRHKLVVPDSKLAAMRFGGTYPSDDPASLVRQLQQVYGVRVEVRGSETVLRSSGQ